MGRISGRRANSLRSHPPPGRARAEGERQVSVKGKKTTPTAGAFAEKNRYDPRAIAKHLNDALSTGDPTRPAY